MTAAREWFEQVRDAAVDIERTARVLERMRAAEGVRGASLNPSVSGSREDVNGTARVDARMDFERRSRRRLEGDRELLRRAGDVIFGPDGDGGIGRGIGPEYATVVWLRSVAYGPGLTTWRNVADRMGMSVTSCRERYAVAMDYVDSVGLGALEGQEA